MRPYVRITSGTKRTGGQKSLDLSRGYPVSKGKPIFQPTSVKFGVGRRNTPTVRVKVVPSNYEWKEHFKQRLREEDPRALAELHRLRTEYERILKQGRGTLVIPKDVPMTLGQSTWLTIGGKFVVLALRSSKVRSYPGFYHMIGGIPFSAKPRRATNKMLRQNTREEIEDELGVRVNKVSLKKPLGVHLTLERDGVGLNVIQSALVNVNPGRFIREHFSMIDPRDSTKGYVLKNEPKEGWEATHFVLIPNNLIELRAFYLKNRGKMTPLLDYIMKQMVMG